MEVVSARRLLLGAASLALALGCVRGGSESSKTASTPISNPPRRPGYDAILVLMPGSEKMLTVWHSLSEELSPQFDVVTEFIDDSSAPSDVQQAIGRVAPKCIVVMDNRTLRLYAAAQRTRSDQRFPPAVVVMTSFLEEQYRAIDNATGIAYEVPAVTLFMELRALVQLPIERVGVIYRNTFAGLIERQRAVAHSEQVKLVGLEVPDEPTPRLIRAALRKLLLHERVDALWVVNDNQLLTAGILRKGWMAALKARPVPVIVGVRGLIDADESFGSFAILPDHTALGVQTANLIYELADRAWDLSGYTVELPLSVETVVDYRQVEARFGFAPGARDQLDVIVE